MSALKKILERYGQRVTLRSGGETREMHVFLQPDATRTEMVPQEQTAIGWVDARLWRCIGTEEMQPGETIVWNEMAFRVRSSRAHCLGDAVHHWQAVVEREAVR